MISVVAARLGLNKLVHTRRPTLGTIHKYIQDQVIVLLLQQR